MTFSKVAQSTLVYWLLAAGVCLYYLSPLFIPGRGEKPIKFGIDLVGGTYISLIVDTEKAIEETLYERLQTIKDDLEQAKLESPVGTKVSDNQLMLTFNSAQAASEALQNIHEAKSGLVLKQDSNSVLISLSKQEEKNIKKWAVDSNISILRNRVDKFAVSEITVAAQGENHIIIELPNVDNPAKAKSMIGKAAILEFKLVQDMGMSQDELLEKYDNDLPEGMIIVPGKVRRGHEAERLYYLVPRFTDVTGKLLRDARPEFGQMAKIAIAFEFSPEGGKRFYNVTSKNIGKQLAIILDGEVISAPRIEAAIRTNGSITGDFTHEQAKELADLLKSGAYVAPVKFDQERVVGPTLGQQAIKQGTLACIVGLALLFIFSLLYYKIPGLFAFLTLVYNLLLILMALAWFRGTLTLPGIASLILTLGMAIDSSILIYEKIKEELRSGNTLGKAIESGFSGALVVILDANITTFIMGVVLYYFGTGPVQGFAITLMIGILTTLITGLFFLRSLFNFCVRVVGVHNMKF